MIGVAKSVVLDRELEKDKSHHSSGSRIRCPLCGWSPRKEDKWFCTCGYEWNTFESNSTVWTGLRKEILRRISKTGARFVANISRRVI